jgi:hypothetical protein
LRILPYFFRHYNNLVDHFFIFDNGSIDGTLEYLAKHPRTTVRHFVTEANSFGLTEIRLSNHIWRDSIGKADWVIMADLDEHIFHQDLRAYLAECCAAGVTALQSIGYEMVSDHFPSADVKLIDELRYGARSLGHDKFCIFDPASISATNFGPGRHTARPTGHVVWPDRAAIRMFHYKKLGADYFVIRHQELSAGLGSHDRLAGYGHHYLWPRDRMLQEFQELLSQARLVPGLGGDEGLEEAETDIERVIAESGLLDRAFYLSQYPDVARASIDPIRHFCIHGWREGRKPNAYFDTAWYTAQQACDGNPLLHYIREGEAADLPPSPCFDPAHYRQTHGLRPGEPALRHRLAAGG